MHTIILSFLFFCCFWFSIIYTVRAQPVSRLQKKAEQYMKRGKQFARRGSSEPGMFQLAVQQFQKALAVLQQAQKQVQTSRERKFISKSLQRCLCNGGYYADKGDMLVLARGWYQKCLSTVLPAAKENIVRQALLRINTKILHIVATVTIHSQPTGAKVTLIKQDGSNQVESTPVTIQVAPGTYTVVVEAPGYESKQEQLSVVAKEHLQQSFLLKKLGTLFLQTAPSSARVELLGGNNFRQNLETPATQDLPEGDYTLIIQKAGYQTHQSKVHILSGVSQKKRIVLVPQMVRVSIETIPSEAQIQIQDAKGEKLIGNSPFKTAVAVGPYSLIVRKSGYRTVAQKVIAQTGENQDRQFILSPVVSPQQRTRTLAWSFMGISIAVAGTGIVIFVVAQNEFVFVDKVRGNTAISTEDINNVYNRGLALYTTGIVLSVVAGITVVTTVGLFILSGSKGNNTPTSTGKSSNTLHSQSELCRKNCIMLFSDQ